MFVRELFSNTLVYNTVSRTPDKHNIIANNNIIYLLSKIYKHYYMCMQFPIIYKMCCYFEGRMR